MTRSPEHKQKPVRFDVVVLGGGNGALCAAIAAREAGASVLVVEKSITAERGGDSRHTRNLRCAHDVPSGTLTGSYSAATYWQDLARVTEGKTNAALAQQMIAASASVRDWLGAQGVRFQPALGGTLSLSHSNAFYLGGGKALLNQLYKRAERLGVMLWYESEAHSLVFDGARFEQLTVNRNGQSVCVEAAALVLASGGFQGNVEWMREAWGDAADNFLIRGSGNNTGELLREALDAGVTPVGDARQCHAVAIDARAPKFDGGIVSRLDCVPFGIVVNERAERFYDEGEDIWPKRYAIWGRLVAEQPNQLAYVLIDSQAINEFMPSVFPPIQANNWEDMARQLDLPAPALAKTVADYNQAVIAGQFMPSELDSCSTQGLTPPKSHWARRLECAPYYAYPLRPGITFTYLGLTVDASARLVFTQHGVSDNAFAAGEIMAGNILGQGYLAGIGMTIGTVFGLAAGAGAAHAAL